MFVSSQALYNGNIIIDGYLGAPNFGKLLISSNVNSDLVKQTSGLAPSGFRVEYMIQDNIGIGVDAIFNYVTTNYKELDTVLLNDQVLITTSDVLAQMKRARIHFRFNYHFDGINPHLDTYFGAGIGTNNRTFYSTRNGVDNTDEFRQSMHLIPVPISMRICVGGRYYFSRNIGVVGEFGFGGPLISLGLSLKY